ncbi:MAG: endopeptidase La [Lachnospiraceae bacterium]|jgi:ATP-dependent Lon protease|nr:endopeptidase La [Lachnospiraceae bacterium]
MSKLMIIPLFDTVILPDVDYQLNIEGLSEEEKSRIKIDGNRAILLPLREGREKNQIVSEDFYPLGVMMDVIQISKTAMGTVLQGHSREKVSVTGIATESGLLEGNATPVDEIMDVTLDGEKKLLDSLKKTTIDLASNIKGGEYAIRFIREIKTVNSFAALFCQLFDMTVEEKYALLRTNSFKERGLLVQEALMRFKGTIDLQIDLNKMDDPEATSYKKAAITKQIGMLQKELDSMDPEATSNEDDYEKKIEEAHMPEEVRKEAERVLKRFKQESTNSPEYSMLSEYLDFITSLKWEAPEQKKIDLAEARKVLNRDHYGLKKVKDRILQQIAVMELNKKQKGSILLLVGAPGTGKTSMGKSVAEALGRKYVRISLGGIRDEAEIRGHRRTYIGAMPGRIMAGIKRAGAMDPVVVLDEVDKLAMSFEGDPSAALLEVLDPEQNSTFTDHYVDLPYDLSHVFFICTANTYDSIPQPLLDRMEVIELPGYTPDEKFHIAKEHLIGQSTEEAGIPKKDLTFTDGAIRRIISDYTMEAGVRGLKKQIDTACRKVAAKIVEEGEKKVSIREKDLDDYLGRRKVSHDRILSNTSLPGVVTGLAWTQAGGEILFIETAAMNGTGQIRLTGQMGDVMKESAETAASLMKSLFISGGTDFRNKDIHIHIPEGAVPKDGPSAGITMFTALTSLVTGIPVSPTLAMTGEISLRGQVLPIGGLPEKLMAAERAGVKTVLIPKENERDLEDVPKETRDRLKIIPVSTAEEVIRQALHVRLPIRNLHPFSGNGEIPYALPKIVTRLT